MIVVQLAPGVRVMFDADSPYLDILHTADASDPLNRRITIASAGVLMEVDRADAEAFEALRSVVPRAGKIGIDVKKA